MGHGNSKSNDEFTLKLKAKRQGVLAPPRRTTKPDTLSAESKSKVADAKLQQETAANGLKKVRKKRNKRPSDGPRKGRKESFTKYIPGYIPPDTEEEKEEGYIKYVPGQGLTVPIDDALGGLFDAADYVDPYTIAREELQHPGATVISNTQVASQPTRNETHCQKTCACAHSDQERNLTGYPHVSCSTKYYDSLFIADFFENEHSGECCDHAGSNANQQCRDGTCDVEAQYDAGNNNGGGCDAGGCGD
ncbi:hypothetical protein V7S43_017478 [Phytophthora oleae]|uniref:Uncharacterized protein n=1 Tax=Phytophthora oleae TaxID=2107226 RepID=A0ABD3EU24_9STRA